MAYTNEYGNAKSKSWVDIDRDDLMDFISVLFISGIQKRKDTPSFWFSNDPIRSNPVMKSIMTGRKFNTMLRYLHVCSLAGQTVVGDDDYDPLYKVKELLEYLEGRYKKLFIPGRNLSLDESLIRSFGRI